MDDSIRNIGQEESGTSAANRRLFASPRNRRGVLVAAIDADAYVKLASPGTSTVATGSMDWHYKIPTGSTLTVPASRSVQPVVTSAGNWRALEVG